MLGDQLQHEVAIIVLVLDASRTSSSARSRWSFCVQTACSEISMGLPWPSSTRTITPGTPAATNFRARSRR